MSITLSSDPPEAKVFATFSGSAMSDLYVRVAYTLLHRFGMKGDLHVCAPNVTAIDVVVEGDLYVEADDFQFYGLTVEGKWYGKRGFLLNSGQKYGLLAENDVK